jgi:Mat/Ecp fimbriae major subunit
MKKLLISAGALAALAFTTPALAATSNTASANATVNIVSPLSLVNNTGLNFGTIVGPFAGEVVHVDTSGARTCPGTLTCSGNAAVSAASFTATGTPSQALTLTIPNSVTLNRVGGGTLSVDLSGDKPANPTLNASGTATFAVGGKLTIPNGTVDGVYSNTFNVTADYQ